MTAAPLAPPWVPEPPLPSVGGSGRVPILVDFPGTAKQNRLTVGFRIILAIPHFVALTAVGIAAFVVVVIGWFGALFTGRLPVFAADFLSGFLRWQTRVYGYVTLLTGAYPPFSLADDPDYPIHVGIQPGRLNRLAVLFRLFLGLPALLMAGILGDSLYPVGFVTWLIVLVRGTMPRTLYQAIAAVVRYQARALGYMALLTAEYPWGLLGDLAATGTVPLLLPPVGTGGAGMPYVTGYMPPGAAPGMGAGFVAPPPGWPEPGARTAGAPPEAAPPVAQPSVGVPADVASAEVKPGGWEPPGAAAPEAVPAGEGSPPAAAPDAVPAGEGPPATAPDAVPAGEGPPAAAPAPAAAPTAVTRWELVLSTPGRWLLGLFMVLGLATAFALGAADQRGYGGLPSFSISVSSVSKTEAINQTEAAHEKLRHDLQTFQQTAASCQGSAQPLTCITAADGKVAAAFGSFSRKVRDIAMPSGAGPAANRVADDAAQIQRDLAKLATATSLAQYQQIVQATGLDQALHQFDQDYQNLGKALGAI